MRPTKRRREADAEDENAEEIGVDEFDSLTRTTFFIIPDESEGANDFEHKNSGFDSGPSSRKRTELKNSSAISLGFEPCVYEGHFEEPRELCELRERKFNEAWRIVKWKIDVSSCPGFVSGVSHRSAWQDVMINLNRDAIDNIARFVEADHWSGDRASILPLHDIPTGLIFSGINGADHDILYSRLFKRILELRPSSFTPHATTALSAPQPSLRAEVRVAHLLPSDCPNLKSAMRITIESFMDPVGEAPQDDEDDDDETDNTSAADLDGDEADLKQRTSRGDPFSSPFTFRKRPAGNSKAVGHDMKVLRAWWRRKREEGTEARLVVMLHDFEGFPPSVVGDLVTVLGLASASGMQARPATLFRHALDPDAARSLSNSEWLKRVVVSLSRKRPSDLIAVLQEVKNLLDGARTDEAKPPRVRNRARDAARTLAAAIDVLSSYNGSTDGQSVRTSGYVRTTNGLDAEKLHGWKGSTSNGSHHGRSTNLARRLRVEEEERRKEMEKGTWKGALAEFENWFSTYVTAGLRTYEEFIGWELEYFDDSGVIEKTFMPQLFPSSHVALAASPSYLRSVVAMAPQSKVRGGGMSPGGRVNGSGKARIPNSVSDTESEMSHDDDATYSDIESDDKLTAEAKAEKLERLQIVHARFARAVAELQMLGYIRSTRRKTDHVSKLKFV
ncbi:hypothetical protein HDU93_008722 [Gonapodya sp. JEL0774]|nr:hypothetical protein HDU93_008722 [Gonapodya sp. JEL0774]